jgi:hypothetical protein
MVVIVLMGDVSPRPSKGKGKEGQVVTVNVKLGRYACLIELLLSLGGVVESKSEERRLRAFAEALESRLGAMLEAEVSRWSDLGLMSDKQEKQGALPQWYKALLCKLFLKLRILTKSIKRFDHLCLADQSLIVGLLGSACSCHG